MTKFETEALDELRKISDALSPTPSSGPKLSGPPSTVFDPPPDRHWKRLPADQIGEKKPKLKDEVTPGIYVRKDAKGKEKPPFQNGELVQYKRNNRTRRLATEWTKEGTEVDWGDPGMDQEYIVEMDSGQTYYIWGSRVFDLDATDLTKEPIFREYPTSMVSHKDHFASDDYAIRRGAEIKIKDDPASPYKGRVLTPKRPKPNTEAAKRKLSINIPNGKIGKAWQPWLGSDKADTINKVIVRGRITGLKDAVPDDEAPLQVDAHGDAVPDPFAKIDEMFESIYPDMTREETRVQPAQHPEHIADDRGRLRSIGGTALNRLGRVNEHSPERDRVHHAEGRARWETMSAREKHTEAQKRVYKIIDALSEVSPSEIESTIEIHKPIFPGHTWLARMALGRRRGANVPELMKGQHAASSRALRSEKIERTTGWVLTDEDQTYIKRTNPNPNRELDLIIEKNTKGKGFKYRSWDGGVEVHDGRPKTDRMESPRIIAVGTEPYPRIAALANSRINILGGRDHTYSSNGTFARYLDHAIEGMTRADKPEGADIDVEITKLIDIGNKLYELGEDHGIDRIIAEDNPYHPDIFGA